MYSGQSIGKCADIDFLKFVDSITRLEAGVVLSIGSAVMPPMIFEKGLSMARNVSLQNDKSLNPSLIGVIDIQPTGDWVWGSGNEPPKTSPAYYLRFAKSFDRMGAEKMYYEEVDNRNYLLSLLHQLRILEGKECSQ